MNIYAGIVINPAPRNRAKNILSALDLRIGDGRNTNFFTPNAIQSAALGWDMAPPTWKCLRTSILSGHPAITYQADDLAFALSQDEVRRLILRALTPGEYFALIDRFGEFFDIHDDFYDPETGEAVQPICPVPERLPPSNRQAWPQFSPPRKSAVTYHVSWLVQHPAIISGEILPILSEHGLDVPLATIDIPKANDIMALIDRIHGSDGVSP